MAREPRLERRREGRPAAKAGVDAAYALLRAAAAAARTTLASETGRAGQSHEAGEFLDQLVSAATQALRGQAVPRGGPAANALGLHCLDVLRREVMLIARGTGTPALLDGIFELLESLESVRVAIEPDWSNAFVSQLSSPSGYDLVISLAHDLRSPLTSVLFLADALSGGRSGPVNELQRRQLRLVYSAALGLSSLTNDVIELARGGEQKEPEPFSLAELLESIRDMVLPIAEEKGVAVRYTLPAVERRVGWPVALSRVILNLTTNALKFTDEGYVEISCAPQGFDGLEFSVRDTGHGIAPEAMDSLYQPFRAARPSPRRSDFRFSGTGLGLAMCRKLLQAMGSELECETHANWGTRFHFQVHLPPAKRL